jgi:hypothetical protein
VFEGVSEFNVAIGQNSMAGALNAAVQNTAVGIESLEAVTSGDSNVAIGFQAGDAITTGTNNIAIGYGADVSSATTSNETVIGNSSQQSVTFTNATGSFGGSVIAGSEKNHGTNGIGEFRGPHTGFTIAAGATKNIDFGLGAALFIVH